MFHKITKIKALPGMMLWAEFKDGAEVIYNASILPSLNPVFQELCDNSELFESVKVDGGGFGISWNDDIDLDAEEVWNNGTIIKAATDLAPGCACPTCGQKIRKRSEAQARASRANLAKRTSKGGRPVNPESKRQKKLASVLSV